MPYQPEGRIVGYARVSTAEQTTRLQRDALEAVPCERIFVDEDASGANRNRPALKQALQFVQPGDMLLSWKLDRLGRSIRDLLDIMADLHARDIGVASLTEPIDTTSVFGEFTFHVIAAVAHMERRLIAERTVAGLDAARRRGQRLGRPSKLDLDTVLDAHSRWRAGADMNVLAAHCGVAPVTLKRAFARMDQAT